MHKFEACAYFESFDGLDGSASALVPLLLSLSPSIFLSLHFLQKRVYRASCTLHIVLFIECVLYSLFSNSLIYKTHPHCVPL